MATRAERVLEAQYQEAVRQRIDDVYDAFVLGTLAARQTLRYARQSVQGLEKLAAKTEELYRGGSVSRGDYNRIKIQLRTAKLGLIDAEAAYRKAKLDLGSLMNLSPEEIEALEIKGSIDRPAPAPARRRGASANRPGRAARRALLSGSAFAAPRPTCGLPGPTGSTTSSSCSSRSPTRTTRPMA